MTGPEIHPAVDANKVQAKRNAEAFSEATQRAVAEATVFAEALKRRRCKKATITLLIRLAVGIAATFLLVGLRKHSLISADISLVGIMFVGSWLTLWVGAWLQFMWGREGLLK